MGFRNIINDGSAAAPRLRMQQSIWGMIHLPFNGPEWPLTEKLDKAMAAGFTGIEASCNDDATVDEIAGPLHDRGLPIGMIARATDADELSPAIERAHKLRAEYLCVHAMGSLKATPQIVDIFREMYEVANDSGLPLLVETHRGHMTQDLRRTVKVLSRFKKIRFMGDFSHYVLCGTVEGEWSGEVWEHFEQIARRCSAWHGRVSSGQQIQVDIGDGSGEAAGQFKKLWTFGMTAWLAKAMPGDVLPFTCELGPAPYSITDLSGRELSDRWQQSLVIKRLAEEAWADAQAAHAAKQAQESNVEETPAVEVAADSASA
jgi:hypothetical protein